MCMYFEILYKSDKYCQWSFEFEQESIGGLAGSNDLCECILHLYLLVVVLDYKLLNFAKIVVLVVTNFSRVFFFMAAD